MSNNIKIALSSPKIKLSVPSYNAELCVASAKEAAASGAAAIAFPELVLTGATIGDLVLYPTLLKNADEALSLYIEKTKELDIMSFIGLPVMHESEIYNSVAVIYRGEILGLTASGIQTRHFKEAPKSPIAIEIAGRKAALSHNRVYTNSATRTTFFVKIGDDEANLCDNVDVVLNPTAMAEYLGLSKKRERYAAAASRELSSAFLIIGAGEGESGTDGIYAGARLAYQNGRRIAVSPLFDDKILYAEFDTSDKKLAYDADEVYDDSLNPMPFIPTSPDDKREACSLAVEIQARALALRMERAYAKCAVLGVSGGLDSTLAVLVAAKAADILKIERSAVLAITMPCFGTTERTKSNALLLAEELGCSVRTIDIKASVTQHFSDISHDADNFNVVYENAQARERTQILMDVANAMGGLVVGTGDLSELALGFATYNGDHMSMYCVNGSVPKTLMREIIKNEARIAKEAFKDRLAEVLIDVVETPISPELLPVTDGENKQHTESIVGPYELHDFFLYHMIKYRRAPSEILSLAVSLFTDYKKDEIKGYLEIFLRRFFSQQFKRSCLPDGPRVTEISLSPRGAWQMPSDVSSKIWLDEINL